MSKVLSILTLDMEDFLFINMDKDQKEMELSISNTIQANLSNLQALFASVAEVGLLYTDDRLTAFEETGLDFIIEDEHHNLETSLREASGYFMKNLTVYLFSTEQTEAAEQQLRCMLNILRKAIDVSNKTMDRSVAIRSAEGCVYYFQKAVQDAKTFFDFTTVLAELNLNESYPDILVYRILEFIEEVIAAVPYISDNVHDSVHRYIARYLESHTSPTVRFAAMNALITVLTVSKASIVQKVNMAAFFKQFEAMIKDNFTGFNEDYLLLFGNLFYKLVKGLHGNLSQNLDKIFSLIVYMGETFCQGRLVMTQPDRTWLSRRS